MKTYSSHAEWIVGKKIKDVSSIEKDDNLISFLITFDDETTLHIETFEREKTLWIFPDDDMCSFEDKEHYKNIGF